MRTQRRFPRLKFSLPVLLLLACFFAWGGCRKAVRVPVSQEDILKANEASQEGDLAFGRKDFWAALIKYLESVQRNPNNEYVYNRLGICYSQLKYYSEAANAFLRSIALNPKYAFSYNNLGSVYFAQKNLKKSEKYFKKALSLKNDEASFHMNLGSLYLEKKRHVEAMQEWRKGLSLDPNVFKSNSISLMGSSTSAAERRYFIARLVASAGDVELAIESLKQAIGEGFTEIDKICKEPDFDRIRADKRFVDFMESAGLLIKLRERTGLPEE